MFVASQLIRTFCPLLASLLENVGEMFTQAGIADTEDAGNEGLPEITAIV
jgi:hypothetical protein